MIISQRAFDMTVAEEVSSRKYYERFYTHPEWPGLSSGVTVGIGYDLGQCTQAKIASDWGDLVPVDMLAVMVGCAGFTGSAGKYKWAGVRNRITIGWDNAMKVFANRDVPQWTAAVLKAVPGADKLNGDLLGVLVDIAYNRGVGGFNSDNPRYREMKAIRMMVSNNQLESVPDQIESMKRLWPNVADLQRRCDHRIALWNIGMAQPPGVVVAATFIPLAPEKTDIILEEGPARTKPASTSETQNAATVSIVVFSLAMTFAQADFMWAVGGAGLAAIMWVTWWKYRNPKSVDFDQLLSR